MILLISIIYLIVAIFVYRYYSLAYSKGGISFGEEIGLMEFLLVITPIINIAPLFLWIWEYPVKGKKISNKFFEKFFFISK